MRLTWLLALLALSCAYPARAQPREGYVTADDGIRLFFKIEGSGPQVLVVVHGGPGGSLESVRPDFGRVTQGLSALSPFKSFIPCKRRSNRSLGKQPKILGLRIVIDRASP